MRPWTDLLGLAFWVGVGIAFAKLRLPRLRVRSVVQTLALIVGQNIPLTAGLRAAARHEEQELRKIYESLASRLEAGAPLGEALRKSCRACSDRVLGAIRAGELGGTLPSVLRSVAADLQREKESVARCAPAAVHFFTLAFVGSSIMLMIAAFQLPQHRAILADFGAEPHPLHEHLSVVTGFLSHHGIVLVSALVILALVTADSLLGWPLLKRLPNRGRWLVAEVDKTVWHVPVLRKIAETRALARQLPIIQAAIRAGSDLAPAARQAACVGVNYRARQQMSRWADRIEAGDDPRSAARTLGLASPLRSALAAARGPQELAAALDYLCSYYRSLLTHWEQLFVSAAIPVTILFWAVCVGYFALALFVPLYAMLDDVMASIY